MERRKNIKISSKHNLRSTFVTLSVLSLAITIPNAFALWPDGLVKQRNHFLAQHQLQHYSPMWSLYDTLFIQSEEAVNISPQNLSTAKKYNFHFQPDVKYPLIKDIIYHGQAPFTKKITQSSNSGSTSQQPNIIIFFTEGFSSRTSNVYGSAYTDITPFLNDFAQHADSMVIDNYYNHTAATYRGLHGQLCSIYPKYGGHGGWHDNYASLPKTDYFCLSHLFNNYNYETMFLHSQFRDTTFIDEMMQILTFNQVWTADSLSKKYLSDQVPLRSNAISDQQLFRGLVGLLKDLEKQQNSSDSNTNKPFFLNIYNFETHAMLDVKEDGKTYGEGDNISLNTIHNLDDAFGKFWKYFQQSPLAENTIVIFTADHCHYHEKVYVEAVNKPGSGYQSIFVDQIPLIIHDPTRKLPSHFDANYASSIDFAPSLVHYLTLPNHINAFMGRSIFEQSRQDQSQTVHVQTKGLASFGRETFLIDKDKIHGGLNFTGSHKETLSDLRQFVRHVQWLEGQNRIWDTNLNVVIQQTIGKQQRVAKSWNN
ncbi:MAG: sulfatase-like hydrolase/transferase [Methylophaga sp.]|nr:sulfatase-like hydrolase/transferase [Methylophaga sp.]